MPWVHGDYIVFGKPIEVLQMQYTRRGLPPIPGGWNARIVLTSTVEIRTTGTYPTREEAQDAIRNAIRAVTD